MLLWLLSNTQDLYVSNPFVLDSLNLFLELSLFRARDNQIGL